MTKSTSTRVTLAAGTKQSRWDASLVGSQSKQASPGNTKGGG